MHLGHIHNRTSPPRRRPRGVTLVELLVVVVLLIVLSVVAYPSLRSFADRDKEAGAVTFASRLINRVKAQAKQRNRAYLMQFSLFGNGAPQGLIQVREGNSPSCRTVSQDPGQARVIQSCALGNTPADNFGCEASQEETVGLLDVFPGSAQQGGLVTLCVKPDGAILDSFTLRPYAAFEGGRAGSLVIRFQRFQTVEGGLVGPPRRLMVPFAGPARMELER